MGGVYERQYLFQPIRWANGTGESNVFPTQRGCPYAPIRGHPHSNHSTLFQPRSNHFNPFHTRGTPHSNPKWRPFTICTPAWHNTSSNQTRVAFPLQEPTHRSTRHPKKASHHIHTEKDFIERCQTIIQSFAGIKQPCLLIVWAGIPLPVCGEYTACMQGIDGGDYTACLFMYARSTRRGIHGLYAGSARPARSCTDNKSHGQIGFFNCRQGIGTSCLE